MEQEFQSDSLMDETLDTSSSNMLSAEELLRIRSIGSRVSDNWESSSKALPKSSQKQFEPNGSTLQNMQIEKGINIRADLLKIERVERASQLACAEWLPAQRKARVTKKSGQDWSTFGSEVNSTLYLIPEEALLLLEMNCLELTWNGVALSVQQAYEVLLDGPECSLEEYRVYSQLVRCGYRLQRFIYDHSIDETFAPKRKVIVNPENGLRMNDGHSQNANEPVKKDAASVQKNTKEINCNSNTAGAQRNLSTATKSKIDEDVRDVVESIVSGVESIGTREASNVNADKKCRGSKVEIVSDETLLGEIKIVKGASETTAKAGANPSKWPGTRIQRNVKLLPKRSDMPSTSEVCVIDSNNAAAEQGNPDKRKIAAPAEDAAAAKRSRHEVIELSDDEIQEVPRPMTRMEMLNLLPNMASLSVLTETISRAYIPRGVKPQKSVYRYERPRTRCEPDSDRRTYPSSHHLNSGRKPSSPAYQPSLNGAPSCRSHIAPFYRQNARANVCDGLRAFFPTFINFNSTFTYARFPYPFHQNSYWHNGSTVIMQNTGMSFVSFGNQNFARPGGVAGSHFAQMARHFAAPGPRRFPSRGGGGGGGQGHCWSPRHPRDEPCQSSFAKLPGAASWAELKKKWRDEKTITIDDEDGSNRDDGDGTDCSEVQVVQRIVNPLVGPRTVSNLGELFERLRIIKPAPEKTVRRRKGKYRISYNVYSSSHHYRKASPGPPQCRVVVVRKGENDFPQPIELTRLQQDARGSQIILARVSMSISYMQVGTVHVPSFG